MIQLRLFIFMSWNCNFYKIRLIILRLIVFVETQLGTLIHNGLIYGHFL